MGTNKTKTLYCDMDGTLARFYEPENCLERFRSEPDYFEKLRPYENLVRAIARLMREGFPVVVLSAVDESIKESSEMQKRKWLERIFAEYGDGDVPPALYPMIGKSKSEYVRSVYGNPEDAVLLDDYSKNLMDWAGQGVKALNEFNGHGGKFTGPRIDIENSSTENIYQALRTLMEE